jgi:hypothetical protein
LHLRVVRARGRLRLCGLDPPIRDVLRICHLDRVFEVYADETAALGDGPADWDQRRADDSANGRAQGVESVV